MDRPAIDHERDAREDDETDAPGRCSAGAAQRRDDGLAVRALSDRLPKPPRKEPNVPTTGGMPSGVET